MSDQTVPSILGLDPGPTSSALVLLHNQVPVWHRQAANAVIRDDLRMLACWRDTRTPADLGVLPVLVIEKIVSYGMSVGEEVFETVHWGGRFAELFEDRWGPYGGTVVRLPRRAVKLALCDSPRANDAAIRTAILDRFGGKLAAVGTKRAPGPLYGITKDLWAALAVALTYRDTLDARPVRPALAQEGARV